MSFRLFIYYCALCGAWAALLGWVPGRLFGIEDKIADSAIKGFFLGLFVSFALGTIDALWNLSSFRQIFQGLMRVVVAVVVGSLGGMIGGAFGQLLYKFWGPLLIVGWAFTGLLIGISVGVFDIAMRFLRQEDVGGALKKLINGGIGGTVGGFLGAILYILIQSAWSSVMSDKPSNKLLSPSSTGFIALGLCIGLLVGLAQIILKEAWVKVETGKRAGKEMILSKKEFTIGRAEACDLGLFGDPAIEKMHARIIQYGNRYYLADLNSPGGTFLNEKRIKEPAPLKTGDAIRVGSCTVRFGERAKR